MWKVVAASSAGTLIEWYDFYIFGSLATIISAKFFPKGNETVALLSTLATFATGFVVRPFGALFFGRIGDLVGRKYAFLVTLLIMGLSTFVIGFAVAETDVCVFCRMIFTFDRGAEPVFEISTVASLFRIDVRNGFSALRLTTLSPVTLNVKSKNVVLWPASRSLA